MWGKRMTSPQPKKSDLPVRAASAVVMIAVAGTALWLGGWWWTVFVATVALGVLWEWFALTREFKYQTLWRMSGLVYVFVSAGTLWQLRSFGIPPVLIVVAAVIGTDIGAYFAGRALRGPKIAPKISPSKTWAGLMGGIVAATLVVYVSTSSFCYNDGPPAWFACLRFDWSELLVTTALGAGIAIVAQTGDFFESWMKRRAGAKDSGKLIPGHGGLFDRVDGLLAVSFVVGLITQFSISGFR